MSKLEKSSPLFPTPYGMEHVAAIQALERGEANSVQQKFILNFIISEVCDNYGMSYRPGEDGRRDTDFAEGKRFVSLTLVKLLKINLMQMKEKKDDGSKQPTRRR